MKKAISLFLALVMCLSLCACGKSKEVKAVEEMIAAIGEVSLESKDAITAAEEAFRALTSEEKEQVGNYFVLAESKDTLEELEEIEEQRLLEEAKKAVAANGQKAYDNIKNAWQIAEQIGHSLYNVWHGAVWEKDEMVAKGIQFFMDETTLSEQEVIEGIASRSYVNTQFTKTGVYWIQLSEEDKQAYREYATEAIEKACRSKQCMAMDDALWSMVNAYLLNGKIGTAQEYLKTAKEAMKELPEDYEHYPTLKGFYTTASSLTDFCKSPSGNLNQYATLLNDYRKEARDYMNDLNFVFE